MWRRKKIWGFITEKLKKKQHKKGQLYIIFKFDINSNYSTNTFYGYNQLQQQR